MGEGIKRVQVRQILLSLLLPPLYVVTDHINRISQGLGYSLGHLGSLSRLCSHMEPQKKQRTSWFLLSRKENLSVISTVLSTYPKYSPYYYGENWLYPSQTSTLLQKFPDKLTKYISGENCLNSQVSHDRTSSLLQSRISNVLCLKGQCWKKSLLKLSGKFVM